MPTIYSDAKPHGCGSNGFVVKAVEKASGQPVAIKKLTAQFNANSGDADADSKLARQTYRELFFLRNLKGDERNKVSTRVEY